MRRIALAIAFVIGCTPTGPPSSATSGTNVPAGTSAIASATPGASPAHPSASLTPVGPGPAAFAIRFVDGSHGWLGIEDGILSTADGGTTWLRQLTSEWIREIWAYDRLHAWARAADGAIYRTEDGTRWSAIPPTTPPIVDLQFVSASVGWAIAVRDPAPPIGRPEAVPGTLLRSTDGGVIWRPVTSRSVRSVCFVDEQRGWGADGKHILRTTDAGRTWTLVADLAIADEGPWYPMLACRDLTTAWVQVTEPYAALSHAPYLVFRTVDAGRSWTLEFRESYTLGQTTPAGTPVLGSYPSLMDMLQDGSVSFITCTPPLDRQRVLVIAPSGDRSLETTIASPTCVADGQVIDARRVVAIRGGTPSAVVRTDDAGRTWRTLSTAPR